MPARCRRPSVLIEKLSENSDISPGKGRQEDRELLSSCFSREPGSWERFLERFARLIYYSIHRTCGLKGYKPTEPEVEDIFSDILVNLIKDDFKKLRLYRGDDGATVATWIRTISVRFVIDYLRLKARTIEYVDIDGEATALEVSLENPVTRPDEDFEETEQMEKLSQAIEGLDEKEKYFMELYYLRGLSPEEVGTVLGLSVKTVYSRINRLQNKLKEKVERN